MQKSRHVPTTNARAQNAVEMIQMACDSQDPGRRAQILADAQAQLAWALRSAVEECVDGKRSWSEIGQAIGLSKESAWRQWDSQGPIVAVRAAQSKTSTNATTLRPDTAIYAFQTEAGTWLGSPDALPEGTYATAFLPFNPANPETNRFANQTLRARYGPWNGDVSFHAALVIEADGTQRRVRVTDEILNLLFGDGQTALRRALTALVQATIHGDGIDPNFRQLVENAAHVQARSVPAAAAQGEELRTPAEFVQAVQDVLDEGKRSRPGDPRVELALQRLDSIVADYTAWARAAR
ncbi:hypothetical protein ACIRU8_45015 [Streptomyces sp. NPDC101175]|uniref:hypothetical protein n=1 Tax=Streptomyces sp. NPDC101175 TaxID=3366123 RepID=UPI003838E4A4